MSDPVQSEFEEALDAVVELARDDFDQITLGVELSRIPQGTMTMIRGVLVHRFNDDPSSFGGDSRWRIVYGRAQRPTYGVWLRMREAALAVTRERTRLDWLFAYYARKGKEDAESETK